MSNLTAAQKLVRSYGVEEWEILMQEVCQCNCGGRVRPRAVSTGGCSSKCRNAQAFDIIQKCGALLGLDL